MTKLILGNAAAILQHDIAASSIDMAYCDPPFGNEQVWHGRAGSFDDRWTASEASAEGWARFNLHCPEGAKLLLAAASRGNQRAYLGAMAGIILGIHRVLKLTGTLWLHFDDTMGAHLRLLCDAVFGPVNALGLVVWKRTTSHANAKCFGRVHDTIAVYGRSRAARWRIWRCAGEFAYGDPTRPWERSGIDGYADDRLNSSSAERIGYPTQKPVALMERFIRCGSLPRDLVLDPTCGSASSLVAASRLGRRVIGIDQSPDAIEIAGRRLADALPRQSQFEFGSAA